MKVYHGSSIEAKKPEILIGKHNKFFSLVFYCIFLIKQAICWVTRFDEGYVNKYDYIEDDS